MSAQKWFEKVRNAAVWINENGERRGDILFIVHGYNMSEGEIIQRHRRIRDDLVTEKFKGVIVLQWRTSQTNKKRGPKSPCGDALGVLPDQKQLGHHTCRRMNRIRLNISLNVPAIRTFIFTALESAEYSWLR